MTNTLRVLEVVIGISSFAWFWYATSWMAAVALFFVLLANNIGHSRNLK
jgi:hypothetical protein